MEDIEKKVAELNGAVNKLIADVQTEHTAMEHKLVSKSSFDEYAANAQKSLNEIYDKLAKLQTPVINAAEEDKKDRETKQRVFTEWLRKGVLGPEERKVLTIADTTHAGVLAPYEYVNEIVKKITLFSPLRQLATIRQTSAYDVEFPSETAIGAATWVAESSEKTETTGLLYALVSAPTFEMKVLYKATQKMLEDSRFNLEAEIASASGRACGVLEGTAFYSGDNTTAPQGITANATVLADARNVATDNTLAFDDFIGTQYQLAEPYARNAAWTFNRSLMGVVVSLKSAATNMYLLQPNLQAGQPATILGSPVYEWSDFPAITSTTLSDGQIVCAYGDFRAGYTIVDRVDVVIQRLVEKYAEFGMIGFLVRKRVGGLVVLPEAIQLLKNITT